jgi:hypothetical protein
MPQITLTASVPQSALVVHAVGVAMGLPGGRDVTIAEVQQFLRDYLQSVVWQVQRNEANAALVVTPLGLT